MTDTINPTAYKNHSPDERSRDMDILFSCRTTKNANLINLILMSQHIKTQIRKEKGTTYILTRKKDRVKAVRSVHLYFKENRFFRLKRQIEAFPLSSFKSLPTLMVMALLALIHLGILNYQIHDQMVLRYGASALYILQDETFRAITALFLHADGRHLLGNIAGMLMFAAPLFSLTGFGAGPFLLLLTGTCGNLINAYAYRTAHLSIGASTAVMGAAGALAAYQVLNRKQKQWLNTLMPIFSGAVLVSLLSQGENTDVWAHVFGFASGLFCGLVFLPVHRLFHFRLKETILLGFTLMIICSAFWSGR